MNYKDFSRVDVENDLYNDDAIKASIINIVTTQKGSIPGKPEFGSNIYSYLFEPMTVFTKISLSDNLKSSIYKNDKRVKWLDINIVDDKSNYSIAVEIKFTTIYDQEPRIITVHLKG